MADQKPSVGRVLVYNQPEYEKPFNYRRNHPCVITKVWTDDCVNVKVFFLLRPTEDRTGCSFSAGMVSWPARV